MSTDGNKNHNGGCIIAVVIFIIVNLINLFNNNGELIASTGQNVLLIAGLVIAYLICKALFGKNNNDKGINTIDNISHNSEAKQSPNNQNSLGCILSGIACIAIFAIVTTVITSSEATNYSVGVAIIIIICVGLGILIYNSFKDEQ